MINKYFLSLVIGFCALTFGFGQVTIEKQSFEASGDTWSYSSNKGNAINGYDLGSDEWHPTSTQGGNTPSDGNNLWGFQDIDNSTYVGDHILEFSSVDVSAYSNVTIEFDWFAEGFNGSDQIGYEVNYGSGWVRTTLCNACTSTQTSGTLSTTETINVANSVNNLQLRLYGNQNGGGQHGGFDNILIKGTPSTTDTTIQFVSSSSSLAEDGLFIDVEVSITNPSTTNASTVQITLNGGTATNGTDYDDGAGTPAAITFPQTLTFPANSSANQSFTIYISNDDSIIELDETIILDLTNASGGDSATLGSITQHTVTINDNDFNDACNTAIPLTVGTSCNNISATNVGATDSGLADPGCGNYQGGDVWFSAVIPASGALTIETSENGGITDSGMAAYSGSCGSLTLIDCDDDGGSGNMSLLNITGQTPGDTIYIRVWEYTNNDFDTFNICAYYNTEIDIERNTFASIANGNAANAGNNTIFASTTIGNSTAPKTYYIRNEGTDILDVTGLSSNNTEFSISTNPAPLTLNPGEFVAFEITFSPTNQGTRNATITILNNDADENPYTFGVQGIGLCAATSISLVPDNGPVNTSVVVTGADFGSSTTASVNGIAATVTVISATEIEVIIPTGATTGSFEVTNDLGCTSNAVFTVIDNLISSCEGSGTIPSDIFISEITDKGSGSHSYIELYNGTGASVNLNNYEIRIHNNGASNATGTIPLSGTLANDDVVVIGFGGSNSMDPEGGYTADIFSTNAVGGINEDDHIRLYKNSTTWVDLWGDTSGNAFTIAPKDYTYRRKNTGITAPSATWNDNDWDSFTPVNYSDIGMYDFSVGTPPTVSLQPNSNSNTCELTASLSVSGSEGFVGGNPLAYQWFVLPPNSSSWTALTNTTPYSGVNTTDLNISDILNLDGYQYYCQIRENNATCYTATNAAKINVARTIWNGTAWSNNAPDTSTIAVIDGGYNTSTNGNIETCMLIVNSGNTLAVTNSHYVEVINDVNNSGTITVSTAGAFVQRGVGSAAGSFNNIASGSSSVTKSTSNFNFNNGNIFYTYWSTPVSNPGNAETVFPDVYNNRRYWYDASKFIDSQIEVNNNNGTTSGQDDIDDDGNDWQNANGGAIEVGRGYAVTSTLPPTPQIFSSTATFNGEFNTGNISVTIYKNNNEYQDNNWNFIGNPYPSAVSAQAFLDANAAINDNPNSLGGALFFWSQATNPSNTNNGNEQVNFSQSDYAIMNGSGGVAGGATTTAPDPYIPSGQGFFVAYEENLTANQNSVSTATVTFTNAMRVTGNNTQFFGANDNSENVNGTATANKLWLNLTSDNGAFGQVCVAYMDNATNAYDGWYYDAPRNLSTGAYATTYTIIDGNDDKFAIQGRSLQNLNTDEAFKLGFYTKIDVATIYTYSLNNYEGNFLNNNNIYIIDYYENTIHNLKESDYSFTSEVGEFNDRFEIVFNYEALSLSENELNANSLVIFEHQDGKVEFKTSENISIKTIEIIDMLGRSIYNLTVKENDTTIYSLPNLSQSTYIANIKLVDGRTISKKLIKQR